MQTSITPDKTKLFKYRTPLPVSEREFARLKKGPKVNIYLGERPDHILIASGFSINTLSMFAPALSTPLKAVHQNDTHIVTLIDLNVSAVSWFLRMADTNFSSSEIDSLRDSDSGRAWDVNTLFERLRILLTLGHHSLIETRITERAKDYVLAGLIPEKHARWLFGSATPKSVYVLAESLIPPICCAVLDGKLKRPIVGTLNLNWFWRRMRCAIAARNFDIMQRYFAFAEPLDHFQMCFVFQFTERYDKARLTVAHGLLWAIRQGWTHQTVDHVATRTKFPEMTVLMREVERWWSDKGWLQDREWGDEMIMEWYYREEEKYWYRVDEMKRLQLEEEVQKVDEVQKGETTPVTAKKKKKRQVKRVRIAEDAVKKMDDAKGVGDCKSADLDGDDVAVVESLAVELPVKVETRRRTKSA